MTLRTVAIPAPAAGVDWSTVVPGNWLYDVTGITATLATGSATVAADSSGNGHDGTYDGNQVFVPGLVAGDTAVQLGPAAFPHGFSHVTIPPVMPDLTQPFSFEFWAANVTPGQGFLGVCRYRSVAGDSNPLFEIYSSQENATDGGIFISAYTIQWQSVAVVDLYDGNPHYIVVTSDGATKFTIWVDGLEIPSVEIGGPNPFTNFTAINAAIGSLAANPNACRGILDEYAVYDQELTALQISTHNNAGLISFADYTAAVLADSPTAYYHLDEDTSTPRQVTLVVATSTGVVADICSGFPLASGTGPYAYSWQPHLTSNSQAPDGSTTSIAIPRLILPAGYTIGADTLDIAAGDQWSDITLWWDDAFMLSGEGTDPFRYPPGAYLLFDNEGAP